MILVALSLGGAGVAWQQWPYRVRAVGQLSFDGLDQLPPEQRRKVHFIHLNHTNPALREESNASNAIAASGFVVARENQRVPL